MVSFKLPSNGKAIADLAVLPAVNKSRKPKFELHFKIYDLNNVPLVSGVSMVKWHLPHSIHGEHRGRTHKRPIANHRVEYNYAKIVPLRLVVDRSNRLADCPIEFEVTQEFENHGASRDEKIVLGKLSLNLAEYVAESEAILREGRRDSSERSASIGGGGGGGGGGWDEPDVGAAATTTATTAGLGHGRAHSKINSTLKIGILMIQIGGERNYVAPALKNAPVFGGIAGIMAGGEVLNGGLNSGSGGGSEGADGSDDPPANSLVGSVLLSASAAKGRETTEIQDVYRRALAASWACQSGELPADECIEDIFKGGDGFRPWGAAGQPPASSSGAAVGGRGGGAAGVAALPSSPSSSSSSSGGGRYRMVRPAATSLKAVAESPGWGPSPPSPYPSTWQRTDEDDVDGAASGGGYESADQYAYETTTASRSSKTASFFPKNPGPIRRKTLPAYITQAHGSRPPPPPMKGSNRAVSGGHTTSSSSGDDGGGGGGGGGGGSLDDDDDDDRDGFAGGGHATLRPRDLRRFCGSPALGSSSSSPSVLAAARLPDRVDSGLSDRTITPEGGSGGGYRHGRDESFVVANSSHRSSPGPQTSFQVQRHGDFGDGGNGNGNGYGNGNDTFDLTLQSGGEAGRPVTPSGRRVGSGGNGSGQEDHPTPLRRTREVDEYDLRDDFVAWQLPGSIRTVS
ncbi:Oestrogen-responsive protein Fam102A/B [Niveomyces insectorum RCEF 264]|uniref:Oestrogen-responsive protein Fam102A/B n=1 Tax=Niveomyces insectorum RCEF 264 TaxID=1081102 RepID=A0A167LXM7_9HYPO|nr:Oestrogen-responsive protein Fam102A/B [Niveomyces insectorum RCEF 264]